MRLDTGTGGDRPSMGHPGRERGYVARAFPQFAWSESRARRFQACPRQHYLATYGSHNGWEPGAPASQRLAWTLGKLIPGWAAALGTAVHERATACLRCCASGACLPRATDLRAAVARDLNTVFVCSRDHVDDFRRSPTHWPVLAASFYGEPWDVTQFRRTRDLLDAALASLLGAEDLWRVVRRAGPQGLLIPDRWSSFVLAPDGVLVFAAPDVVVRPAPTEPAEIWDFKVTLHPDGVIDQLLVYGLAARAGFGVAPAAPPSAPYLGRVVQLSADADSRQRDAFEITERDLASATSRIRASVSAMRALLVDVPNNVPKDVHDFPQTNRRSRCRWCSYRGICDPETYDLGLPAPLRDELTVLGWTA